MPLIAIFLTGALAMQAPAPPAALERALADAMLAKDAATLDRLLDASFVMRGSPDRDRAAWLDTALKSCWGDRVDLDDVSVRFTSGNVAVVTLQSTFHVDPTTCAPAIVRSLITDTWHLGGDGAWRLAVRHASAPGGLGSQYARLDAPPPPFEGRAQLAYLTTRGNTRTGSLSGGVDMTWRAGAWTTNGAVSGLRADADGEPRARRAAAELRASRKLRDRVSIFGRAAGLRDRFSGIDSQFTFNGGASVSLVGAPHELDVDVSIGYLDENRVAEPRKQSITGDTGARLRARISETVTVADASLLTADLREFGDWRLHNKLALEVALRRWLAIELAHTVDFRNRPIEGFRGTDQSLSTSIVTRF